MSLSRRKFLAAGGLSAAALLSFRLRLALAQGEELEDDPSYNELYGNPPMLGRVHGAERIRVFTSPDVNAGSTRNIYWGNVIPIYRSLHSMPYDARAQSTVWFETEDGYVHSGYVVPCHEHYQEPEERVTGEGFWGEVVVPMARQYYFPRLNGVPWDFPWYTIFWGQVHRVVERAADDTGRVWYRLLDEIENKRPAWVQARYIRKIAREEFDPISPNVEDKLIEIVLEDQTLTCYEEGKAVFKTRIASGTSLTSSEGVEIDFSTPYGEYTVQRKRPSRRMRGGESFGKEFIYDVNGVPWVTYFTFTGAAIHGAYWHNNFGRPRSHGCINVTPDAAKWIYRWTQPYLTYDEDYRWVEEGEKATHISIV